MYPLVKIISIAVYHLCAVHALRGGWAVLEDNRLRFYTEFEGNFVTVMMFLNYRSTAGYNYRREK